MAGKKSTSQSRSALLAPPSVPPKTTPPRVVVQNPSTANPIASTSRAVAPGVDDLEPWVPEDSEMESNGFTQDRKLAMGVLVDTHYRLGQGIGELIQGNPMKRFMELAA
ncbi:hypothetical protein BY996DRAFT_6420850, partial [Phakopsora pachyrhizi]